MKEGSIKKRNSQPAVTPWERGNKGATIRRELSYPINIIVVEQRKRNKREALTPNRQEKEEVKIQKI